MLTGAGGMLGGELAKVAADQGWELRALDRSRVDLARWDSVSELLTGYDVLIHAAANTNVEACEVDPFECFRDNAVLTEVMASAARECGVRMIYISSTGVYGEHLDVPYTEFDRTLPTTMHHRAKLLGEQSVLRLPRSLIVRTGWLFGGAPTNPKNFVARRVDEARTSTAEMLSNSSQRGCPSYVKDVASRLFVLIRSDCSGVFNCVNTGSASRYEYVKAIVDFCGLDVRVKPTHGDAFGRKARVSNNEMARNWKQDMLDMPPLRDWREALYDYISENLLKS